MKQFKIFLAGLLTSTLAFGTLMPIASMADELVPTKSEWQKKKKEFHIPSGLSKSVKMGDSFQKYHDDLNKERSKQDRDYEAWLPIFDALLDDIGDYSSDMAKHKKYKKHKDFPTAAKYLSEVYKKVVDSKKLAENIVNAGDNVKDLIDKAKKNYAGFDKNTNKKTMASFWSQEVRAIGTAVPTLVKKDKKFSSAHKKYRKAVNEIKKLVEVKDEEFDAEAALKLIKKSVEELEEELDNLGAW